MVLVVAAALLRPDGRVLMHRRPAGKAARRAVGIPRRQGRKGRISAICACSRDRGGARNPARSRGVRSRPDSRRAGPIGHPAIVILLYTARNWRGEPEAPRRRRMGLVHAARGRGAGEAAARCIAAGGADRRRVRALPRQGHVPMCRPHRAPVAQLDRASDYGSEGRTFRIVPGAPINKGPPPAGGGLFVYWRILLQAELALNAAVSKLNCFLEPKWPPSIFSTASNRITIAIALLLDKLEQTHGETDERMPPVRAPDLGD